MVDGQINEIENSLRRVIDAVLRGAFGERYWREVIPSDIQQKVDERITDQLRKKPYLDADVYVQPSARLQFCDVPDYLKIIGGKRSWQLFCSHFSPRTHFEFYISTFSDFRNIVKHNRDLDDFTRRQGETAIAWFQLCLGRISLASPEFFELETPALLLSAQPSNLLATPERPISVAPDLVDAGTTGGQSDEAASTATTGEVSAPLQTPLSLPMLAPDVVKLLRRIRRSGFADPRSVEEVLALSADEFAAFPRVGAKYVEILKRFQSALSSVPEAARALERTRIRREEEHLKKLLEGEHTLNASWLSDGERRFVNRLFGSHAPRVAELMQRNPLELTASKELRKPDALRLAALQERVRAELLDLDVSSDSDIPSQSLVVSATPRRISLADLEVMLMDDFSFCLAAQSERDKAVALAVWGYTVPKRTLEDLGNEYGIERERIRQLNERVRGRIPISMRVHSSVIRSNLESHLESDLCALMPMLSRSFERHQEFFKFLELCAGMEEGSLAAVQLREKPGAGLLDEFVANRPSPYALGDLLDELVRLGYSGIQAKHCIDDLIAVQRLRHRNGEIVPARLSKELAFTHVLLDFPQGLRWREAARLVNERSLARTVIDESRLDLALGTAECIYLCGRGEYRHVSFLGLSTDAAETLAGQVRRLLDAIPERTAKLEMLHQQIGSEVDYYALRYSVKTFADEFGLHFAGESSADTVSLDAEAPRISTDGYLAQIIAASSDGETAESLAGRLRSKSTGLAHLSLTRLSRAGRIVPVRRGVYVDRKRMLENIDAQALAQALGECVESGSTDLETVRAQVNAELGSRFPAAFYEAFVEDHGKNHGLALGEGKSLTLHAENHRGSFSS